MEEIRKLAKHRRFLSRERGKIIVKIKDILRKYNMEQDCPTKEFKTKKCRKWLKELNLPKADRLIVDSLMCFWEIYDKQILPIEEELNRSGEQNIENFHLTTIPGITFMGATILTSYIGEIQRFKSPDSLVNYFGLAPNCHNSGETNNRNGSITKKGSSLVRDTLNYAIVHVNRKDPQMRAWHKKIKKRRGAKVARVAVMRKLTVIIWNMMKWKSDYQFRFTPPLPTHQKSSE